MTTKSEDRLLGIALVALLAAMGGELLGMTSLVGIGLTGFVLAVTGLFALMTVTLLVGLGRTSGPDMSGSILTERTPLSTRPDER